MLEIPGDLRRWGAQMAPEHGQGRSMQLQPFELRSDPERLMDEADLRDNIALGQPPDLPFANLFITS